MSAHPEGKWSGKMATQAKQTYPSEAADSAPIIGYFEVTKVVREGITLRGGGSNTYGEMVDAYLHERAQEGTEVQEIRLHFEAEQWNIAAAMYRAASKPAY